MVENIFSIHSHSAHACSNKCTPLFLKKSVCLEKPHFICNNRTDFTGGVMHSAFCFFFSFSSYLQQWCLFLLDQLYGYLFGLHSGWHVEVEDLPGPVDEVEMLSAVPPWNNKYHNLHYIDEPLHINTGLEIFVVVIPKEGLAGTSPAKPTFGMTPTVKHNLWRWRSTVLFNVIEEALASLVPAKSSFGTTMTNSLRLF